VNVEIKAAFVDRPECQETFVDSVRLVGVMDGVVRVELSPGRMSRVRLSRRPRSFIRSLDLP
jgi:hypothetical protein